MKRCHSCKTNYPDSEAFCARCGTALGTLAFWQKYGLTLSLIGAFLFVGGILWAVALSIPRESRQTTSPSISLAASPTPVPTSPPYIYYSTPEEDPKTVAIRDVSLVLDSWTKGGFDSVMIANLTIKNPTKYSVKDISVTCTHYAASGTEIDRNTRTIYEMVKAKGQKRIREFNMGFIHSQAQRTHCQIDDLAVVQ
jgi:hypothetical protein